MSHGRAESSAVPILNNQHPNPDPCTAACPQLALRARRLHADSSAPVSNLHDAQSLLACCTALVRSVCAHGAGSGGSDQGRGAAASSATGHPAPGEPSGGASGAQGLSRGQGPSTGPGPADDLAWRLAVAEALVQVRVHVLHCWYVTQCIGCIGAWAAWLW